MVRKSIGRTISAAKSVNCGVLLYYGINAADSMDNINKRFAKRPTRLCTLTTIDYGCAG